MEDLHATADRLFAELKVRARAEGNGAMAIGNPHPDRRSRFGDGEMSQPRSATRWAQLHHVFVQAFLTICNRAGRCLAVGADG